MLAAIVSQTLSMGVPLMSSNVLMPCILIWRDLWKVRSNECNLGVSE